MTKRVLAPSDLASDPFERPIRVGGRLRCDANGRWRIADAFESVRVISDEALPSDGSLVVAEGDWRQGKLHGARIVEVHAAEAKKGLGESNRFIDNGVGSRLRQRAAVLRTVRAWFDDHGFLEVETPQRVPSPGLDLHLDAMEADGAYLITSPEYQMKRLLSGGMPRIYQLVHCFRAGERGNLHNSEFLMLEWYRAFATIDDVIHDTEQVVAHVATTTTGGSFVVWNGRRIELQPPLEQLTVAEAFDRFAGLDTDAMLKLAEDDEETYFRRLIDEVEPALASLSHAVVLRDFPAVHASLARNCPHDARFCERFEIYAGGVELCNGFGELTNPKEQRRRFEKDQRLRRDAGKPCYPMDERFLQSLQEGMPPSGGNALGIDRLVALCLDSERIADAMAFPDEWV